MSEFTDDILDGIFCASCGELIDLEGAGHIQYCAYCAQYVDEDLKDYVATSNKQVEGDEQGKD